MPKLPKWLGDTMEVMFRSYLHEITVAAAWSPAPNLRVVRFSGDLHKAGFTAGDVMRFRVTETEFRHYTISHFHREEGMFEVYFYLHGKGPGSQWAAALQPGDTMKALGPAGHLHFQPGSLFHVVFGDETAVGLAKAIQEAALQRSQECASLIEMSERWELDEETVPADPEAPARHAIIRLNTWLEVYRAALPETTFYLAGRAKSIQAVRDHLRGRGISKSRIITEPYWSEGKRGL